MSLHSSQRRRTCECGNPIKPDANGCHRCLALESERSCVRRATCGAPDQDEKQYGLMAEMNRACRDFFESRGIGEDDP